MDNGEGDYHLPVTEYQKTKGRLLLHTLHNKDCDIPLLHDLFYSFTTPPSENKPLKRWDDTLQCFLAVKNMRKDGTSESAGTVAAQLSRWEYLIRGTALYEISENWEGQGFSSQLESVAIMFRAYPILMR